jgi:flavorubredoxin
MDLGGMKMSFMETRMLHWPDSMFSYLADEKILFTQDGFGMHLASFERFADQVPEWLLKFEAENYFANILTPFSELIKKVLAKVTSTGWEINIIAPDHGPVWRKDLGQVIGWYSSWADRKPSNKAVIAFDTMWGSTARMAKAIAEGISAEGGNPVIMPLSSNHRSEIATQIHDSGALIIGSPTLNGNMFPTVADLLSYVGGLKFTKLIGGAFGSYGWGGEAVGQIEALLKNSKIELAAESIKCKYVPDDETLKNCINMGRTIGKRLNESVG